MTRYYIFDDQNGNPGQLVESFVLPDGMTLTSVQDVLNKANEPEERITPKTLDGLRELVFEIQRRNLSEQIGNEEFDGLIVAWRQDPSSSYRDAEITVSVRPELVDYFSQTFEDEPVVTIVTIVPRGHRRQDVD